MEPCAGRRFVRAWGPGLPSLGAGSCRLDSGVAVLGWHGRPFGRAPRRAHGWRTRHAPFAAPWLEGAAVAAAQGGSEALG